MPTPKALTNEEMRSKLKGSATPASNPFVDRPSSPAQNPFNISSPAQEKKPMLESGVFGFLGNVGKGIGEFGVNAFRQTAKLGVQFPRAVIAGTAGLMGNEEVEKKFTEPVNIAPLGEVRALSAKPGDIEEHSAQTPLETAGQGATAFLELGLPGVGKLVKKPFTALAERLYQSALKPGVEAVEKGVVQTGLAERVWLTKGGVERAAQKIDELEEMIGKAIDEGKAAGKTITTAGIEDFVEPIRKFYDTVDVKLADKAKAAIDDLVSGFKEKYADDIPIEEAQKLKVNTMRFLRDAYGELSTVEKEAQKQMVRFLKEGISEQAPIVDEVNKRLRGLYELDRSLEKAARRIGNLNLLGLGTKIGGAAGGKASAVVGLVADLMDKAGIKSGAAIGINELTKLGGKAGAAARIPIAELLNYIHKNFGMDEPTNQ